MAKGEERGFYLVEFDGKVTNIRFTGISVAEVVELEYSAEGKSSRDAFEEILMVARASNVTGKIVLLKMRGELSSGKTSDIDFGKVREMLISKDPISIFLNYSQLTSKERAMATGPPKGAQATEREVFSRRINTVTSSESNLRGENGVKTSVELLRTLKVEKRENENKSDYQDRTESAGLNVLGLREES
jgi:hypothetical protein